MAETTEPQPDNLHELPKEPETVATEQLESPPLSSEAPIASEQSKELASEEEATPKPKKKHRVLKWVLIIIGILVLLIGLATFWLFYFRHFNFGHGSGDIGIIKAGVFEGTMNQFAPHMGSNESTIYMNRQIFEGLVRYEGKTRIVPILAEGWSNPNQKTWVFKLKDGINFHNGSPLEPKDVLYSYEQYKSDPDFAYVTETIETVQATGPEEVTITTKEVDPILLNRLVDMFIIDDAAAGAMSPEYGTGPYTLKPATTPTKEHIELIAATPYHGGQVRTKEVHITVYQEDELSTVTKDFILGRLNIVAFVPQSVVATAESLNFRSGFKDDPAVYEIALNVNKTDSPVANVEVRRAIQRAIDVPALLLAIERDDTGTPTGQVLTPDIPGHNIDIPAVGVNKDEARRLLSEAGYPNGFDMTLTVFSAARDAGEEISRQLGEVGIRTKLDVRDDLTKLEEDVKQGRLEAFYFAETTRLLDGSDVLGKLNNTVNYHNDRVAQLVTSANSTLDVTSRLAHLKDASKILADELPVIPLYSNRSLWIMDRAYDMPEDTLDGLGVYVYKVHLP